MKQTRTTQKRLCGYNALGSPGERALNTSALKKCLAGGWSVPFFWVCGVMILRQPCWTGPHGGRPTVLTGVNSTFPWWHGRLANQAKAEVNCSGKGDANSLSSEASSLTKGSCLPWIPTASGPKLNLISLAFKHQSPADSLLCHQLHLTCLQNSFSTPIKELHSFPCLSPTTMPVHPSIRQDLWLFFPPSDLSKWVQHSLQGKSP